MYRASQPFKPVKQIKLVKPVKPLKPAKPQKPIKKIFSTIYYVFDKILCLWQGISEYEKFHKLPFLCELVPVTPFYPRSWTIAHLAGIDNGPVLDWIDNNGLSECYWIWKKRVEILFHRPLHVAGDGIKCNYLIYWSGKPGMELVDKWETEGKMTQANRNNINRYFELFEEHILPKSNTLIALVELKRLFQGTLSLEDFDTKALRLVKEAEYPKGDMCIWILWDTIISGLTSDKICAKVIKEGKDVTLAWVMEIAWLEVSTQQHLDQMQENAKVNYVKYDRGSKAKGRSKLKPSGSNSRGGSWPKTGNTSKALKLSTKGKKPKLLNDICWTCGKPRHQKKKYCKALEAVCRGCGTKGHYEKVCMKKATHLVGIQNNSNNSNDSDPDYYNELGDPVYAQMHMVCINQTNKKKHLIQFPISVDLQKVRKPVKTPCPTVLLKADTSADVNLLNSSTFNKIIGDRSLL